MKEIRLPQSTLLTRDGPRLVVEKNSIDSDISNVSLDYDHASGKESVWTRIFFSGVTAYKFTGETACDVEMMVHGFVDLGETKWLSELRKNQAGNSKEGKNAVHHFLIYFDDVGAYEVIACGFEIRKI